MSAIDSTASVCSIADSSSIPTFTSEERQSIHSKRKALTLQRLQKLINNNPLISNKFKTNTNTYESSRESSPDRLELTADNLQKFESQKMKKPIEIPKPESEPNTYTVDDALTIRQSIQELRKQLQKLREASKPLKIKKSTPKQKKRKLLKSTKLVPKCSRPVLKSKLNRGIARAPVKQRSITKKPKNGKSKPKKKNDSSQENISSEELQLSHNLGFIQAKLLELDVARKEQKELEKRVTTLEEKLNKKSVEQQYIAHQLKKVTRKVKNCLASEIMEQLRKQQGDINKLYSEFYEQKFKYKNVDQTVHLHSEKQKQLEKMQADLERRLNLQYAKLNEFTTQFKQLTAQSEKDDTRKSDINTTSEHQPPPKPSNFATITQANIEELKQMNARLKAELLARKHLSPSSSDESISSSSTELHVNNITEKKRPQTAQEAIQDKLKSIKQSYQQVFGKEKNK